MEIEFRKLDPGDSNDFRELRLEFIEKYPMSFGMDTDSEAFKPLDYFRDRIEQSHLVGAFDDGKLVGVIGFSRYKTSKEMHKGYIFSFGIIDDYRGKGLGRRLLNNLVEAVRLEYPDVEQITLKVESQNHPAYNLYASEGFQEYGVERRAIRVKDQYYDYVYMVKFL